MSYELICSWLGLPAESWPPDHYRLLGLEPGEGDTALIEQRVHQRIDSVRCYQMRYPDQATEAMRLLARAFDCLTDPIGKKVYDAELLGTTSVATAEPPGRAELEARDPLAWLYDPPPPRAGGILPPGASEPSDPTVVSAPTIEMPPLPPVPPAPVPLAPVAAPPVAPSPSDPVIEAASSPPARRRLSTKRGLYQRIVVTRSLIRAWSSVGRYLSSPKRRLNRPSEATDLIQLLEEIQDLLRQFPPLLGEAGQPGYHVVTLSQLVIVPTFQTMDLKARRALSDDWKRGLRLLQAHRDFLRQEIRQMRQRAFISRVARPLQSLPHDSPFIFSLFMIALVAANIALIRYLGFAFGFWE